MELLLNLELPVDELVSSRSRPLTAQPPALSGLYAIFLREESEIPGIASRPRGIVYIGKSANLGQREFDTHFADGGTGVSTLRRSLGALLREELNLAAAAPIAAESAPNAKHFGFDTAGEKRLTAWMIENLEVGFCPAAPERIEEIEKDLIAELEPVFNLTGWDHPNRGEIERLRKVCADEAAGEAAVAPGPVNPMNLFNLLRLHQSDLDASECKVHLAVWNGYEDPLDLYLAGKFDAWQAEQKGKNFRLPYVVSLIKTPQPHVWLFAGVYSSNGCRNKEETGLYEYDLTRVESCADLSGRLYVFFQRTGRASYLLAQKWADRMTIVEYRATPLRVAEFPGYSNVLVRKPVLDIIVSEAIESWKAALSSVAGVYLISDTKAGKLYVGSATGVGGIWQRWVDYSQTGHGGNKKLRDVLNDEGPGHANHFQYSILEIADTHASHEDIIERETFWKNVLLTREYGYNGN